MTKTRQMEEPAKDIKERTFDFAKRIIKLCLELEKIPGCSRLLANQLFRSGTSIGANVEEANGSQSKADFTAKIYISCKEARETHYWLRLLAETEIVREKKLEWILDEANQLVAILTTIAKNSRKK
jgi:four helix bundle protein